MDKAIEDTGGGSPSPSAVYSMTGFGAGKYAGAEVNIDVEIKSVNSRFLDLIFKLPAVYSRFELALGEVVREHLKRGRVEVLVSRQAKDSMHAELCLDPAMFRAYFKCYEQAFKLAGLSISNHGELVITEILRRKELIVSAVDVEKMVELEFPHLKQALVQGLDSLRGMRLREGQSLGREVERLAAEVREIVLQMRSFTSNVAQWYRDKLATRIAQLGISADTDPQRLAQEVAYFADRSDVTEELARLDSHLEQLPIILAEGGGRKLEFLLQEMGREVNTIGSKSLERRLSELVISAKALLEKVREQIQNIE